MIREDGTKGNVCAPRVLAEYKKFVEKVMDNLREQVLYKEGTGSGGCRSQLEVESR